jgi:hypothetical protein
VVKKKPKPTEKPNNANANNNNNNNNNNVRVAYDAHVDGERRATARRERPRQNGLFFV